MPQTQGAGQAPHTNPTRGSLATHSLAGAGHYTSGLPQFAAVRSVEVLASVA
jgi:hypothetical protein